MSSKEISTAATSDWVEKHYNALLGAILIGAAALYAFFFPRFSTGFLNDDALYVIVARDLWKTTLTHPLLGVKPDYPMPGVPLLLAPWAHVLEPRHLELISAPMTLLAVFLLERLAKRWLSPRETLAATALYAFNPVVASLSGILMATPYYTAGCLAVFLLMRSALEAPSFSANLLLGFLLGWTSLSRPEGVLLLAAVAGTLATTPSGRRALKGMSIPLSAWLAFFLFWMAASRKPGSAYGADWVELASYWIHHFPEAAMSSGKIVRVFLVGTLAVLRLCRLPSAATVIAIVEAVCVAAIAAGFHSLWKNRTDRPVLKAIAVFCASHFTLHLFWQVATARYFVPILPFTVAFFARGLGFSFPVLGREKKWVLAGMPLLFASYVYWNGYGLREALFVPDSFKAPPWRTLAWIKDNTPTDAAITSNIAPCIDLYTGRPAMERVDARNADAFLYLVMKKRLDYIVLRDVPALVAGVGSVDDPNIMWRRYQRWMRLYPKRFPCAFYDATEKTGVYRVQSDPVFVDAYENFVRAVKDYRAKKHDEALLRARLCAYMAPQMGCVHNLLGTLYFMGGRRTSAEFEFHRAMELLPDSSNPAKNLASVYRWGGEAGLAMEYIDRGRQISAANGNQTRFANDWRYIQEQWEAGRNPMFLETLPPELSQDAKS